MAFGAQFSVPSVKFTGTLLVFRIYRVWFFSLPGVTVPQFMLVALWVKAASKYAAQPTVFMVPVDDKRRTKVKPISAANSKAKRIAVKTMAFVLFETDIVIE